MLVVPNTNTKARCTGDDDTPPRYLLTTYFDAARGSRLASTAGGMLTTRRVSRTIGAATAEACPSRRRCSRARDMRRVARVRWSSSPSGFYGRTGYTTTPRSPGQPGCARRPRRRRRGPGQSVSRWRTWRYGTTGACRTRRSRGWRTSANGSGTSTRSLVGANGRSPARRGAPYGTRRREGRQRRNATMANGPRADGDGGGGGGRAAARRCVARRRERGLLDAAGASQRRRGAAIGIPRDGIGRRRGDD